MLPSPGLRPLVARRCPAVCRWAVASSHTVVDRCLPRRRGPPNVDWR